MCCCVIYDAPERPNIKSTITRKNRRTQNGNNNRRAFRSETLQWLWKMWNLYVVVVALGSGKRRAQSVFIARHMKMPIAPWHLGQFAQHPVDPALAYNTAMRVLAEREFMYWEHAKITNCLLHRFMSEGWTDRKTMSTAGFGFYRRKNHSRLSSNSPVKLSTHYHRSLSRFCLSKPKIHSVLRTKYSTYTSWQNVIDHSTPFGVSVPSKRLNFTLNATRSVLYTASFGLSGFGKCLRRAEI